MRTNYNRAQLALIITLLQVGASLSQDLPRKVGFDRDRGHNPQQATGELVDVRVRRGQLAEDVAIRLAGYGGASVGRRRKRDEEQKLKNVVTREIFGEPVPKTAWIRCETEKSCVTSQQISHMVQLTTKEEISAEFSLILFKVAGDVVDLANATASGVSTSYSFTLDSPSEGRLMFTPKLVEISGQLEGKKGNITLLAPKKTFTSDGQDHVDGIWWVQYKPDHEPVDDINFYNLRHKDYDAEWDSGTKKLARNSGSPRMCAESALRRGFNFAIWNNGECWFKQTIDTKGRLTSSEAKPIGNYYLPIPAHLVVDSSQPEVRDGWVRQGRCDLISEIEGEGFYCELFKDSPTAVMMFRRSKEFMGEAGERSRSNATYDPDTPDPKPIDEVNFYNIRHKNIPKDCYEFEDQLSSWFKSPKKCAEAALKRGHNFASWSAGGCWIKHMEDGVGRLTSGDAKPIGYYNLSTPDEKSSCNSGDRDQWVAKKECALIQELDGCYHCKTFRDHENTVLMFRRSKEYVGEPVDVNLPVAAPAPELDTPDPELKDTVNFFHIQHRDIPKECLKDAEKLSGSFGSPKKCAGAALQRGFNMAAWYKESCWLYPSKDGDGLITSEDAKPIGHFNPPITNRKASCNLKDRDEWVIKRECGLIQELNDCYYCKSLRYYKDSVLMLRRSSEYLGVAGDRSLSNATFNSDTPDPHSIDDVNFYHIHDRDTCSECYRDVEMLPNWFKSPKLCAEAALRRGFNMASWYKGGCWLYPTKVGLGRLMTEDAKPIGNYSPPVTSKKTSCNTSDRDEWVLHRDCGLIKELNGCYHCKALRYYKDAVMMFRRSKESAGRA